VLATAGCSTQKPGVNTSVKTANSTTTSSTMSTSSVSSTTSSLNSETTTSNNSSDKSSSNVKSSSADVSSSIIYKNSQYGFTFTLPSSWSGYKIVKTSWQGNSINSTGAEKIVETGPILSIRSPQWTSKNPRQDIPIMIYTLKQWDMLQQEKFSVSAAPIPPSEIGHNSKFVFAIPARYNFAFLPGYQEVETILNNHPLQTF
jgi:hypothetical protein